MANNSKYSSRIEASKRFNSTVSIAYVTLACMMMTLQSFYFAGGASWLCYIGLLLLAPLAVRGHLQAESTLLFGAALCFTAIQVFSGSGIEPKSAFGVLFSSSGLVIVSIAFRDRKKLLETAIRICIWFHLAAFFSQCGYWLLTGSVLDITGSLGFESASWSSIKGFNFGGIQIPRFSGLLNEPGTYSAVTIALAVSYYALTRAVTPVFVIALISIISSASLSGVVLVVALLFAVSVDRMRRGRSGRFVTGAFLLFAAGAGALWLRSLFDQRASFRTPESTYHSTMARWVTAPENLSVFGLSRDSLPAMFVVNDIGVWADILVRWGVVGLLALLAYILFVVGGVQALLIAPLILTKLKVTYPLLFLAIAIVRLGPTSEGSRPV